MTNAQLKLIITFRKSVIDVASLKNYAKQFFEDFYEKRNVQCNINISEPRNIDIDIVYKAELNELEVTLEYINYKANFQAGDQLKLFGPDWCDPNKNLLSHLWLRLANRSVLQIKAKQSHPDIDIKEIAFGTLPSMQHFMQHYHYETQSSNKELMSTFLHNQRFFVLYSCLSHHSSNRFRCSNEGQTHKFVVYYKSISRVIVNYIPSQEAVHLYFILRNFPFVYIEKQMKKDDNEEIKGGFREKFLASDQEYQDKKWERSLIFGCKCKRSECHINKIGRCPVFKIVIARRNRAYGIIERLIQRCAASTYFFFSNIGISIPSRQLGTFEVFPDNDTLLRSSIDRSGVLDIKFRCQFAWEVVNGRSLEVRDQILLKYEISEGMVEHWDKIRELLKKSAADVEALSNTLFHISEMISRSEIFTFEDAFSKLYEHYRRNVPRLDLPEGMCFVRRLIITPSKWMCLPPSEHFDNRVIREYGSDHLLRVSIQDDNFSKLTFAVQYHTKKELFMDHVACNMLRNGIKIGPRCYEFLASSNSQLREHGLWMFARDHDGNIAETIRAWMGDFSHIRNVAKYMARMGQCFSSSEEAVQIELDNEDVLDFNDIKTENKKYTFSDGVGMISTELAKEVRKAMDKRLPLRIDGSRPIYEPSSFQIRFKGCKGMVAENPTLTGRKLGIRPSMEKFQCDNSNLLEIVKISAPRGLFLNRPLITILEQLGVRANVFLKLQKEMVLDLTDSLIYEKKAWRMMSNLTTLDYPYRRLLKAGICLTEEPFFRSLLLSVYKVAIDQLRSKARIAIPPKLGRNLLGVLDETDTLKYGQVFVQYSHELGNSHSATTVLERVVVVTKNPCMHPGDVRKLEAIDVPALHHIKDCIVFPARGNRPHTDEMGGSDLDGDEYVVIWYDDLIFSEPNYPPMHYPANRETIHPGSIRVPDMIDFLCLYIQNDNIGVLANAHLASADYYSDGIFNKICMQIAQKYPQVLDFAKSGSTCYLKAEEKPKMYPDFMEKGVSNNSYKSKKALGLLYRVTRNLEACVSKIDITSQSKTGDAHFEYSGWEHYKASAECHMREYNKRVKNILKKYGLQSETEALTGYAGKMNEFTENRYERDNALSIARTYILDAVKRFRMKFYTAYDTECRTNNIPRSELQEIKYRRASAWYMVTYQSTDNPVLSFPWINHDLLCEIREKNLNMRGLTPSVPRSSFINSSDHDLMRMLPQYQSQLHGKCYCVLVLYNTVLDWITKSVLNLTMSAGGIFCMSCYHRIIDSFMETCTLQTCCYFSEEICECSTSCSPTKLILEFMKFYATEVQSNIGSCTAFTSAGNICNGFRELNLQSIALRTYASLAITRDMQYLGWSVNRDGVTIDENTNEEGDPIRVSVSTDFEALLTHHGEELIAKLKALSGVKDIFINPEKDPRGNWYILVHSIGRAWQRWNLEELIMDDGIVPLIRSQLNLE